MAVLLLLSLFISACSTPTEAAPGSTTPTTTTQISVPSQLIDFDVAQVQVGERRLLLAIADNPSLRSQGLQGVTDLGDLDGMLFLWHHDGDAFWMKDTLIPLDIVWFNEDGTYKDRASMLPCVQDPCPTYAPENLDFRFAIEAPLGTLSWITESTVITHSG